MKLSDFILLNEKDKKHTVLHRGVLVAKRMTCGCMVFLFQLENYYVEAYCNLQNKSLREFRVFDDVNRLTPYLDEISIEHLLT